MLLIECYGYGVMPHNIYWVYMYLPGNALGTLSLAACNAQTEAYLTIYSRSGLAILPHQPHVPHSTLSSTQACMLHRNDHHLIRYKKVGGGGNVAFISVHSSPESGTGA